MLHKSLTKKAFSLLELIFVIVILGIVSSIGAQIIANIYDQYIIQKAQHNASLKTELAATQIANRLRYAIPGTVFRIKNDNSTEAIESSFTGTGDGDDYIGLQWIAYDGDSFEALNSSSGREPGWSGFCDLNSSSKNSIKTLGSKLPLVDDIIHNLSSGTKSISNGKIFFPYSNVDHNISGIVGDDVITLVNSASRTLAEQYKLAWSSYALVVDPTDNSLYLYYNFAPTPQLLYTNGTKVLLMKNISTFKFKGTGGSIRFKLCKEEQIGQDFNITACKEKVAL